MNKKLLLVIAIAIPVVPLFELSLQLGRDIGSGSFPAILAFYYPARAAALIGFVLMFYQFVIGAKLPVVEKHVAPRGKLLKNHRSLGKVGFILMLLHGLFMLGFDLHESGRIVFNTGKLMGIIALFMLILAVVASWWFKPLQFKYQTWKKIHLLAYAVFPTAFFHALLIGSTLQGSLTTRYLFWLLLIVYIGIVGYKVMSIGSEPQKPATKKKAPAAGSSESASPASGPANA